MPYHGFLSRKRSKGEGALLGCEGCRGVASSPSERPGATAIAAPSSELSNTR
jgi:hypothetical protein